MAGVGGGREEQLRKEYAGPTGTGYLKLHLHRYLYNNATLYLVPETESLKSGKMIACLPIVRSYESGWCCVYFVGKRRNIFFHWLDLRSVLRRVCRVKCGFRGVFYLPKESAGYHVIE